MNQDEVRKYEIKRGLECCSVIRFETGCSDCPYRYRCVALYRDALNIITEQEKEIEQLTRELAKEQEACAECELEQSWELFVRDKESVLEIEKKQAVKEFAEKLKARIKKFIWRHNIPKCIFNDIMSDLLKEYEE